MGDSEVSKIDAEIEKLKADIAQEEQASDMLDQSVEDLKSTIVDLNIELEDLEEYDSDGQWKARYDEQLDMNKYLEQQIAMLNDKLKEFKGEIAQTGVNNNTGIFEIDHFNELELKRLIKQLEKEKREVGGILKDLEWQLDTESKARYRINGDIMEYKTGLVEAQGKAENVRMTEIKQGKSQNKRAKNIKYNSLRSPRIASKDRYYGIPDNQRIIDPKKGPVKRTALAGHLPKIDSRDGNNSVKSSPGPQKTTASVAPRGFSSAEEARQKYVAYPRRSDPL